MQRSYDARFKGKFLVNAMGTTDDWRGIVVVPAANNWDGVRFHDRQLAENLTEFAPVLYVDPPISLISARRRPEYASLLKEPRLRIVAPRLARLTPVVLPGMERPGMATVTRLLMARAIRRAARQLGGNVATVLESSVLVPVAGLCGEDRKIYWAQDDFVGSAELLGLSATRIARGEKKLLGQVDTIIAANPSVADSLRSAGHDPALIPYGCDIDMFKESPGTPPADDVTLPGPIAGFMGHIGDRIDIELLEAVAQTGVSLLLVGPRHPRFAIDRMASLLARPNVQWVGPRDFEDLPRYLRLMDVGLVPYNFSAFNIGSFPLKMLEYLAAGVGVVATDLPAVRWLDSDFIRVASEPAAYADAVLEALKDPRPEDAAARQEFAGRHSWKRRAQAFAEVMASPPRERAKPRS